MSYDRIWVSRRLADITADAIWLLMNEPQTPQGKMNLEAIRDNAGGLRRELGLYAEPEPPEGPTQTEMERVKALGRELRWLLELE